MQKYQDVVAIVGPPGLMPVRGASVRVNTNGTSTAATIFSDNTSTQASNPLTTDASGKFSFYAADGRYDCVISGNSITSYTLSDILLEDPTTGNFSTLSTNTFAISSSSQIANLNASLLTGFAWPSPPAIGNTARSTGAFSLLSAISTFAFSTQTFAPDGAAATPSYSFASETGTGMYRSGSQTIAWGTTGTPRAALSGSDLQLRSDGSVGWSSGVIGVGSDVILIREAANILALRNGTNPQAIHVYGSTTGTKYGALLHDGTNAIVSTTAGGLALSASTMSFFSTAVTTQPNVSTAVSTTAPTSNTPFGFASSQQAQDVMNAVRFLQQAMKQLGLSG